MRERDILLSPATVIGYNQIDLLSFRTEILCFLNMRPGLYLKDVRSKSNDNNRRYQYCMIRGQHASATRLPRAVQFGFSSNLEPL
jgi:hypothetical protein